MKRKPDPVEFVAVLVPVLAEAVAVAFAIAVAAIWLGVLGHQI